MSLPVLIGFAGVLVAAVATGMLAGRCVRQPGIAVIAWTAATLALTVALAAESTGFARGFGPVTFRAVQLSALLLAPLWMAWGLAEQLWPNDAARFGARLGCGALTVIGTVILATDPLAGQPFGKSWPPAGQHYQAPSHYALDAAQAVAVVTAVTTTALAAACARSNRRRRGTLTGSALISLAVLITVGQRFSLPARSLYPLIGMAAAALIWYGAITLQNLSSHGGRGRAAGRDHTPGRAVLVSHDGRVEQDREVAGSPSAMSGYRGSEDRAPYPPREDGGRRPDPGSRPWPLPAVAPGAPGAEPAGAGAEFGARATPAVSAAATPARPYGRILIFTLLDDRVAVFDRLAEQAAEEVRTCEPDTLVYVIHLVPNAPMQRIFYEIYRDRTAFDRHESQPYMQRFVAERRSCVLATNVIELRLKYAKVAPLPNPQPPAQAAPPGPAQMPPGQPQPPQGVQALEPLPPGPLAPDRRLPAAGRRHGGP